MTASALIRSARRKAGLTQAQLAARVGTTQSAVARLERPGSNPRFETIDALLCACGRRIEVGDASPYAEVDEGQILERLRLTPQERLDTFHASQHAMVRTLRTVRRVDPTAT